MVNINAPNDTVNYQTNQSLTCTLEEATGSAGWNLSRPFERFSINNGLQAKIFTNCVTEDYKSCVRVNLTSVTGAWAGKYTNLEYIKLCCLTEINCLFRYDTILNVYCTLLSYNQAFQI